MIGTAIDVALLALLTFSELRRVRGQWIWHRTLIEDAPGHG
jgi:hypothetical protein